MLSQNFLPLFGKNEQRKTCGQRLIRQDDQTVGRSDSQRGWKGNVHEAGISRMTGAELLQ